MVSKKTIASVLAIAVLAGGVGTFAFTGVMGSEEAEEPYDGKAISFIAFCSVDGVDEGDVVITDVVEDSDGEAVAVSYNVSVRLSNVTYKAAGEIRDIHDPANPGTVATGDGVLNSALSPPSPCPSGQSGVKFENYDSSTGEWEVEEV